MKKLLLIFVILSLSQFTYAYPHPSYKGDYKGEVANYKGERMVPLPGPCGVEPGILGGFYIGAQGGYDSYRITESIDDGAGNTFDPALNPAGLVGGIFAGFGQYFSEVAYIGAEVFGNWSGSSNSWSATTAVASFHTTVKGQGDYGIHLIPGIRINNNTLVYLRAGFNRARFRVQEYGTATGLGNFSITKGTWQNGAAAGVGIETLIYQNWNLRAEYTYARYRSFTNSVSFSSFTPSDNQFLLGLLFRFA